MLLKTAPPHTGVIASKWQLTFVQVPGTGRGVCGQAEVVFL